MPESRNREKHYQHHSIPIHHAPIRPKRKAAFVVAILVAVMGFALMYFTQGADSFLLIAGTILGGIVGFFLGASMDRSMEKKSSKR